MKKIIPFVLILCLCFNTFSMTLAEKAADETTAEELYQAGSDPTGAALTDKSPAEMTAEELYQAGDHASHRRRSWEIRPQCSF